MKMQEKRRRHENCNVWKSLLNSSKNGVVMEIVRFNLIVLAPHFHNENYIETVSRSSNENELKSVLCNVWIVYLLNLPNSQSCFGPISNSCSLLNGRKIVYMKRNTISSLYVIYMYNILAHWYFIHIRLYIYIWNSVWRYVILLWEYLWQSAIQMTSSTIWAWRRS